jgi:peptide/nickel transport system substrate-binding protein
MALTPTRRTVLSAALATTCVVAMTACTTAPKADNAPKVFSVAASAAITTWDPVRSFSTEALYMGNIYEPLIWKNPAGSPDEFAPAIAESWSASADGKTWTFNIRQGATFHDGEPVNAAAVKASIEAAMERAAASFIWAPVQSLETPDEHTVVIHLKNAAPLDLVAASTYGAWIVSPKALEASKADEKYFEAGKDAGTGPYTIDSYAPGSKVVLKKFDKHWNKEAPVHYDIVDVAITPDSVTAQQMLVAKEVDYATNVPLENVNTLKEQGFTVNESKSPFNFLAMFNTTRAPLNDPKVRQALSYAIPYEEIIDVGGQGYGSQAHGPVPDGIYPFDESVPQYTQDLAKAKQLLAEAGHGDGLHLKLTYSSENPAEVRFVPLIKDAFARIGVDLEVKSELFNQQWKNAKSDPASAQDIFVLYYWPTYSDAGSDNMVSLFRSSEKPSFNLSYWKNAEYDLLVDEAVTLAGADRQGAQRLYSQALNMLHDQAPAAFLYDAKAISVVPEGLQAAPFNENYPFTVFFAGMKPRS